MRYSDLSKDNRYYICVKDNLGAEFMLGKAKTIIEWKEWFLENRLKSASSFDDIVNNENTRKLWHEFVDLRENEVIPYIENFFNIKIVALNGNEILEGKYLLVDEHKILTETKVRQLLFENEQNDVWDNWKDYVDKHLDIDCVTRLMKIALNGDIKDVIAELELWDIPIVKIVNEK